MARKPCLVCGDASEQSRCPRHRTRKTTDNGPRYGRQHDKLKRQTVALWVRTYGWVCPGWRIPAHAVGEGGLEGEHIISRAVRPDLAYEPSNYSVLCRSCNARKGSRSA